MTNFVLSKRAGMVIAGIILLLIIGDVGLHALVNAGRLRPVLEKTLAEALGREVKVTDLKLAIFSGGVHAVGLSIADDAAFSREPFVQAQSVKVSVELLPLIFSQRLNLKGLTIEGPQVVLIEEPGGRWNYSSLGAKTSPDAKNITATSGAEASRMQIGSIGISGGRITVTTNTATPLILDHVNVETQGISTTSALPFSLTASLAGDGAMQVTGTVGPVNPSDTAATPVQAKLHITHLDLAKSGLIDSAAGLGGIATLDATASQQGDAVRLDGTLKAEQWKVARNGSPAKRPLEFDFTINHDRKQQAGDVTRGDLHLGSAVARLTGHYDLRGKVPVVDLTLAAPSFAGIEIGDALPAMDVVLPAGASLDGGTVTVNLRSAGPVDRLTTSGTIRVANVKLANFDLGSKLQAIQSLGAIKASPHTEIETLQANVQSTPESTGLDGIQLVVPSLGAITGAGTVSASHALNFKMRVAVTGTGGFIPALGKVGSIPFTVQGTSQDPKFMPDVGALVTDKMKSFTGNNPAATDLIDGILGRKK